MNDSSEHELSPEHEEFLKKMSELIPMLSDKNGLVRQSAREEIVSLGKESVEYLAELIENPKKIMRREAVRALDEIADPDSAPLFLLALEDNDEGVRWIAAIGLIILGKKSIKPLLKTIIEKPDSLFIRKGAHHILRSFSKIGIGPDTESLIQALNSKEANLSAPIEAEKILNIL